MSASLQTTRGFFGRAATAIFAVWFCGAYCLVCSVSRIEASESEGTTVCTAHSCCQAKSDDVSGSGDAASGNESTNSLACCAPFGQTALLAAKQTFSVENAAGLTKWTPPALRSTAHPILVARRVHVPDRGGTHLKCCVFLI